MLGRPAPAFVLKDAWGKTWDLGEAVRDGPVVVVFYLGSTCMACVTHLVELDVAMSRFRERGARVLAVSGDSPEFSLERMRKFGDFQIPLLSDPDHAVPRPTASGRRSRAGTRTTARPLHGTFIIDRDGLVRWAYVGDRPFTDIEALISEVDALKTFDVQRHRNIR